MISMHWINALGSPAKSSIWSSSSMPTLVIALHIVLLTLKKIGQFHTMTNARIWRSFSYSWKVYLLEQRLRLTHKIFFLRIPKNSDAAHTFGLQISLKICKSWESTLLKTHWYQVQLQGSH